MPVSTAAPRRESRREVTTLFTDLSGFTALSTRLDAEDLHALIQSYFDTVQSVVERLGGSVERYLGDAVMAIFGATVAHEDDALRAVRAGLEIQAAMPELGRRFGQGLQCVVGIATGDVVVMEPRPGYPAEVAVIGESVNLASRIEALGQPGEVLVSQNVHRLVAARVQAQSRGAHMFKGFEKPIEVWRIEGLRDLAAPDSARFVGRAAERAQIRAEQNRIVAQRRAGLLTLCAEAGMGKSRLLAQAVRDAEQAGFVVHRGWFLDFGLRRGTEGLHAVAASLLGIEPAALPAQRQQAGQQAIAQGAVPPDLLPSLLELLGAPQTEATRGAFDAMDRQAREHSFVQAAIALVRWAAATRALLVVLEDVHWADAADLGRLARVVGACHDLPLLLAVTTRVADARFDTELASACGLPELRLMLQPFTPDDLRQLAAGLGRVEPQVLDNCIERCNGNPLFFEQLLRHMLENGGSMLPPSIRSLVLARMDRLEPAQRWLLQAASVLGQRFPLDGLRALLDAQQAEDALDCAALVQARLLQDERDGYAFEHALIHEAAYSSLLKRHARELHQRAAAWYAPRDAWLRAQHLERAEDPGATRAYLESATADVEQGLYERARAQVERAEQLAGEPAERTELALLRGRLLHDLGETAAARQAYEQALAMPGDAVLTCRAWTGRAACQRLSDDIDGALQALDEAQALAQPRALDAELSRIHYLRGSLMFPRGDIDRCLSEHGRALEHARRAGLLKAQAEALSGLGDAHYARGRMRTAHRQFQECMALCEQHGFGRIEASNRFMLATVRIYLNETEGALRDALDSAELARRVSNMRAEIVSRLTAAWILISLGRLDAARAEAERGLAVAQTLGAGRFRPFLLESVARVELLQGRHGEAARVIGEALALAREASMMRFIGPWLLGTSAWCAEDDRARQAALDEGAALLAQGCVGHNYYRFYAHAIEASLAAGDLPRVRRWAEALREYTQPEPNPWADFHIDFALARLPAGAQDEQRRATLQRLLDQTRNAGFTRETALLQGLLADAATATLQRSTS